MLWSTLHVTFCMHAMLLPVHVAGLDNGVALAPPMGFNDWNEIAAKYPPWKDGLNESMVFAVAKALVDTGLRDKGYKYVNLDCGYTKQRDSDGKLLADSKLFPTGMKAVGDKIKALGLKYGIYTSGKHCCANVGSFGHEESDVKQFVLEWGVDYVKNDDCGAPSFQKFQDALNATGKHVVHSIHTHWTHTGKASELGPADSPPLANLWRTTNDIKNNWAAIIDRAETNNAYAALARKGAWNDPDMLEVGNAGVSDAEGRTHFALWALMKAPLLIGTDVTVATQQTIDTLGNEEVIAVNQDQLGIQGTLRTLRDCKSPASAFPINKTGVQVWGLTHDTGAATPSECAAHCCAQLECKVWQWRIADSACYHGQADSRPQQKSDAWIGGERSSQNEFQIWTGPLTQGCHAAVLVNLKDTPTTVTLSWEQLNNVSSHTTLFVRDLWARQDLGAHTGHITAEISDAHGNQMYKLCPQHVIKQVLV